VPKQAITMTVYQIMRSEMIVSSVPHKVKVNAIRDFFANDVTNQVPATILKIRITIYSLTKASEVDLTLISNKA
jgi:6-phosphogluconolactonase/glucosamine-6-phosphate isomerase/deaminase